MILDSLNNTERYEALHPLFKKAFDFLKNTDFSKLEDGKHIIEGDDLYVNIFTITGKDKHDAVLEIHKEYIDIQTPLLGVEKIGWKPTSDLMAEKKLYDVESDCALYADKPTARTKIYPGQFAIYFPSDGHAPGIGRGSIRKAVVKIKA
jgi:YhcH/YjgK/YiaL family protein